MIANELLESAAKSLKARIAKDVMIGLGYTAVHLDDGSCGLAATIRDEASDCCSLVDKAGELANCSAYSLAKLIMSTDILESSIGLATINANTNKDMKSNTTSVLEALDIGNGDIIGMVGHFRPLVEPIQQRCKQLHVFERKSSDADFVHPDWAADMLLPQCNKVIISGTTLINKTIDHILEHCYGMIAVMGPSTPLSPILGKHGISFAFGVNVTDVTKILRIVSQAGGTMSFGKAVEKINLEF